jgi:hypothetical protein
MSHNLRKALNLLQTIAGGNKVSMDTVVAIALEPASEVSVEHAARAASKLTARRLRQAVRKKLAAQDEQ